MSMRVVVLGAGFGGLDLTSILSDSIADQVEIAAEKEEFGATRRTRWFGR
jgi:NADH dehydrogenase FAD-containing subunit